MILLFKSVRVISVKLFRVKCCYFGINRMVYCTQHANIRRGGGGGGGGGGGRGGGGTLETLWEKLPSPPPRPLDSTLLTSDPVPHTAQVFIVVLQQLRIRLRLQVEIVTKMDDSPFCLPTHIKPVAILHATLHLDRNVFLDSFNLWFLHMYK